MHDALDADLWTSASLEDLMSTLRRDHGGPMSGSIMVFQQKLRAVDVYCYLKARFGEPNGLQNMLRKDDSDNLFHWDYLIRSGEDYINFIGGNREIHVGTSASFDIKEWNDLVIVLRREFKKYSKAKAEI